MNYLDTCKGCKTNKHITLICSASKYRDVYWCSQCGSLCEVNYNYNSPITEWSLPKEKLAVTV